MLPENLCRFLAIDFDNHKENAALWKSDILAVHNTSSELNISSYIEISRSGNGGHLWFFFEENISARLARKFGSAILKLAMQKRHSISFLHFAFLSAGIGSSLFCSPKTDAALYQKQERIRTSNQNHHVKMV